MWHLLSGTSLCDTEPGKSLVGTFPCMAEGVQLRIVLWDAEHIISTLLASSIGCSP